MNNEEQKRILVTGGAGFIGSNICKKYLDEGHYVICLDNLQTTFDKKNIENLLRHPHFEFIKHDVINPIKVSGKIDWIFNLACSGSYTSYQFNPVHTLKTNTIGVLNVLDIARQHQARVLQASTSEIYGDPEEVPQKESYRGNVNILGPRACYDEGKRCAETLFMDYHREYGVDVRIVRIFNTYGPKMDVNDGRAMTNFIINAIDGKDLVLYGDGSHTRSFQYIDDLLSGMHKMMVQDGFVGPVNLGNPSREISMKDLAELVVDITSSSSKIVFKGDQATDDPKRRKPDISLAKEKLNWEPCVGLEEGIQKTSSYFSKTPRSYSKVLVFSTTYYPVEGPAEFALRELSEDMTETDFHVVTTRFTKNTPSFEKVGNTNVYRVGFGLKIDKFILPLLGLFKALSLNKRNKYRFVWSIMGSYSGLTALFFRFFSKKALLLVTIDKNEKIYGKEGSNSFVSFIYRLVLKSASQVYVSDLESDRKSRILDGVKVRNKGVDVKDFVNELRFRYADLINQQEGKLQRPK